MQQTQSSIEIQPTEFDYQRNGVSGIPFYTLKFNWKEGEASGQDFIATFETDDDDQLVKYESCRVVNPRTALMGWRGDMFGLAINETLKKMQEKYRLPYLSDLQQVINRVMV